MESGRLAHTNSNWLGGAHAREPVSFPCIFLHHTTHAIDDFRPPSFLVFSSVFNVLFLQRRRLNRKMLLLPRQAGPPPAPPTSERYQTAPLLNHRSPLLALTITFIVSLPL